MNIHTISDDNFFSLGCETIFKLSDYKLNKIEFKELRLPRPGKEIKNGDIVLVAISSHIQALKTLEHISNIGAEAMLFIDLPKKEYALMSWLGVFFSKRMRVNLLMHYVENLPHPAENGIKLLTSREKEVMGKLFDGFSFEEVSSSLNISIKTIHTHRRNSFKKIGLDHAKSFFYIGYQNYLISKHDNT